MFWVRIDNRLVHGQVIESWLPFTDARYMVVANDELAQDELRQQIMSIAIPLGIDFSFVKVAEVQTYLDSRRLMERDVLVLFASCPDARRAFEAGLDFRKLNLGNLHYGPGKRQVCQHIALSKEDETCLDFLRGKGVNLDYRCIPSDPVDLPG
ncbi:PTS system mannose-specific EIIAB component [Fundidesulfovibrio magnetotacticus]|uniref:PTS system mannose-specific EIIAB component n=1 Tax=Fundidesulfovibrio magnetotacticus TaxID=2730080 RepID=A0A6V8LRP0_9BACT|nr:PTS sugar transporter subunit IIB [Fundidesulfovibrio magnetotacticus]GFK95143.1 PTS system mannose-specific EIIAB component [Fundidesulfovibrio magnetotacticus]